MADAGDAMGCRLPDGGAQLSDWVRNPAVAHTPCQRSSRPLFLAPFDVRELVIEVRALIIPVLRWHRDCPIWLNFGKFQENRSTGYVLKPPYMRGKGPKMLPCQLVVNVLSCQRLPNNDASSDIVDVYVVLELHGLPNDIQVRRRGPGTLGRGTQGCVRV